MNMAAVARLEQSRRLSDSKDQVLIKINGLQEGECEHKDND